MSAAPSSDPRMRASEAAAAAVADQARARREGRGALRWSTAAIVAATLVLAAFNAESARSWSDGLKPDDATLRIQEVCHAWADLTAGAGLSEPRFALRRAWRRGLAAPWPDRRPPAGQR